MSGHYIRRRLRVLLPILFLGIGIVADAQWGRISGQEKGDVVGRNITIYWDLEEHDGIFEAYTGGDPDDSASSNVIEMLGPPDFEILTNTMATFKAASSAYRGAFRFPRSILSRNQRKTVVQLIRDMRDRSPAIGYVSSLPPPPYARNYLTWTERDGNPAALSLIDIDTMRSDAVVEFAYAKNGFPIVRPNLFNTIINSPGLFEAITSSGNLLPSDQLYRMTPAIAVAPTVVVYDANDNPLSSGAASSMTVINVYVYDEHSGPGGLQVFKDGSLAAASYIPMDDLDYIYDASDANLSILGSLTDGQYEIRAIDQAGNYTSTGFMIRTSGPSTDNKDQAGETLPDVFPSTYCVAGHAEDPSGIASITVSSSGFSDTTYFDCSAAKKSTAAVGHVLCNLVPGSYTTTSVNCADVSDQHNFTVSLGTPSTGVACVDGKGCSSFTTVSGEPVKVVINTTGPCGGCSLDTFCESVALNPNTSCRSSGGLPFINEYIGTCGRGVNYTVVNTTDTRWPTALQINAGMGNLAFFNDVHAPFVSDSFSGYVKVPQTGEICTPPNTANTATVSSSYWALLSALANLLGKLLSAVIRQNLAYFPGSLNGVFGSDVVLTSTGTISFSLPDPSSIVVSTPTLAIYRFDGVDWSSTAVTNQTVSKNTATSIISATGTITMSGYYALFFLADDSSAPITTFAIQGSSFAFDGALFVSTDAFAVLTATDPVINGYASTVASITYRLDPSSGSPFHIYSSSIPLPLGTHILEYRSWDYAGNAEAIKTATFTVTAGAAMRASNTAHVPGTLLNGFLGSGAKLEVESQAQNSLTLLISSANRQALVSVDNSGEVGIGVTPQANLNIGASSIGLQLRSGNSTSSVTSAQIAFGYNGDSSMRHFMRTEHSTSTDGNKMDFLVWNTGAGSTATLAGLNVLSLQGIKTASGGSFHVQPVGEPDAEVEVSNGLTTGGGTMQRLDLVSPSSRLFKTDIKDLSEKAEDRALADVAGLKHAWFRYKSRQKDGRLFEDPAQPLRTGLIYEEAPESIREGNEALSTSERLVNVELALKASMRRLEELQTRYEKLKARRTTP